MRSVFSVLLLMVLSFSVDVQAKNHTAGPKFSEFFLDNGLHLVVIPDRRAPVVTHSIWYKVGGADDPPGKSGLAHYFEHLMFKGTEKNPGDTFSKAVAEIGGAENAFTSTDYTGYYQKITPSALPAMMAMEADRMRNLVLSDDIVLPELEVILEERNQRVSSNPGSKLSEISQAALFLHHPYGNPIIGWEHEIKGLTRADAVSFYNKWYRPSNAIVVIAGDVEADDVLALARQTYAKIKDNAPPVERRRVMEPTPVAARSVTYSDPRVTTPSWRRTYLVPSYMGAEAGEAEALEILAAILGGASTSRLHRELVLDTRMAIGAGAYYQGNSRDMGYFSVYGRPRGNNTLDTLEQAVDTQIEKIIAEGVSKEELERARQSFLKSIIYSQDSQLTLVRIFGAVLAIGGSIPDFTEWPDRRIG